MKSFLVMGISAVGLLCVTVVGLLGMQGRLNYEGTASLPWIQGLFDPPATSVSNSHGTAARALPKPTDAGRMVAAKTPSPSPLTEPRPVRAKFDVAPAPVRKNFEPGELFDLNGLEANGVGVEEVHQLVEQVRRAEAGLAKERAALAKSHQDLSVREAELARVQSQVQGWLREIETRRKQLNQAIAAFHRRVLELPESALPGLREVARTLARLRPDAAADVMSEFWAEPGGPEKVVRILAVMDPAPADEILACMDVKRVHEVLALRMRLVRTGKAKGRRK